MDKRFLHPAKETNGTDDGAEAHLEHTGSYRGEKGWKGSEADTNPEAVFLVTLPRKKPNIYIYKV